jgi:RNA polymerase sigma factor (sigma-70 family)
MSTAVHVHDRELLRRTRAGEPQAFAAFYRARRGDVLAFLRVRVRSSELATDLMCETFARALLAVHDQQRDLPAVPLAWLLTIARNELVDSVRRGRVADATRRRLAMEPLELSDRDLAAVDQAAADTDLLAHLRELLPEDQLQALTARVIDERDYTDIAHDLETSPKRCAQARQPRPRAAALDARGDTMTSALDQFERQLVAASRELSNPTPAQLPAPATPATDRAVPESRRGRRFPQRRLVIAFAAMIVVGGGVAAASSILWPSQRLADGRVNCFMATHGTGAIDDKTLAVGDAKPNGQPPISFCRMWYRINRYRLNGSQTGPKVANLPLIACQENPTTVGVYVATGRPDQCQTLGEQPLPTTYASAAARLRDLQQTLLAAQNERDCPSVTSIAANTRAILARNGFTHWRVITPPSPDPYNRWIFGYPLPAGTGGTCGTLLTGSYPPSNIINIDTQRQTITVSVGPPRAIALAVNRIMGQLVANTSQRCYTLRTFRTLAQHAFAKTPLAPRFAVVARQQGETYEPPRAERLYDQGCVRPFLGTPGNNNRFIDILLNARNAPRLPTGDVYPPAESFHP